MPQPASIAAPSSSASSSTAHLHPHLHSNWHPPHLPRSRRRSCLRPHQDRADASNRTWNRSNMKPPNLFTEADFEALPFSVQRKYFSSLERLRIAENSALPPLPPRRTVLDPSPFLHSPLAAIQSPNSQRRSDTRARRRLRKPQAIRQEYNISQAEAQWFLSLPEKVRRRHFSREEQVLLAGNCELYLADSVGGSEYTLADHEVSDNAEHREGDETESKRGRARQRSLSVDSVNVHKPVDTPNRQQDTHETFMNLNDMSPVETRHPRHSPRRSSFRRTISLTAIPFRASTSTAPPTPRFPVTTSPWRPRASSSGGARHLREISMPVLEPEAKYYRDPEARKQIRQYLACPQKFDEVVEFGFPSANEQPPTLPLPKTKPGSEPQKISHALQTFLRDDTLSFLSLNPEDRSDTDVDSVAELDSPRTPSDTAGPFRYPSRFPSSNFSSLDSGGLPSLHSRHKTMDPSFHSLIGHREMTLRMTLTKPELRADDDALYGWQLHGSKNDPLALEDLPMSDDVTGQNGPFSAGLQRNKSVLGRLLSKVKRRRQ